MITNKDQIFKFLTGTLPKEQYNNFLEELLNSKELQEMFLKESNLEALFYSQQWSSKDINEETIFGSINSVSSLSDDEYEKLLPKKNRKFSFLTKFTYSIAAILILSLTLTFTFLSIKSQKTPQVVNSHDQDSTYYIITDNKSSFDNKPQVIKEFNTKVLKIKNNAKFKKIKLSKNASYINKKISDFKILKNSDSIAIIHLLKGEMQFFVKTGSYKKFAVITDHAEIRVTGTIFNVSTNENTTNATVYRGSVLITDKSGIQTTLDANSSKILKVSTTGINEIDLIDMLKIDTSKSFLKDFLSQYDNKSKLSIVTDSILATINNSTQGILKKARSINSPETNVQMMHLNVAQKFKSENNDKDAIKTLKNLLNEDIDKTVKQLAIIMLGKLYYQNESEIFISEFRETILTYQDHSFAEHFLLLMIFTEKKIYKTQSFYKHAEEFVTMYSNNNYNDVLYWYLSQRDLTKKDYNSAIENFNKIIDKYPESQFVDDARYWLGWCLINRPKEFSGLK